MDGRRLKRLRESRELTQGQLAAYADVTQGHVSAIERGETSNVTAATVEALARVLQTNVGYLLREHEDPRPPQHPRPGELNLMEETLIEAFRALKTDNLRQLAISMVENLKQAG